MIPVAPRIVLDVSCLTRIYHESHFSWQVQYQRLASGGKPGVAPGSLPRAGNGAARAGPALACARSSPGALDAAPPASKFQQ